MSSLDKLINKLVNWNAFHERTIPMEVEITSPTVEITTLMQKYRMLQEQEKQRQDQMRAIYHDILAQQSVFITQLGLVLKKNKQKLEDASLKKVYRSLDILKSQMIENISSSNIEVIDPLGQTFDQISDSVTVLGWRHQEQFTEEVVAEVIEPIVRYQGQLIRPGIVVMGAPISTAETSSQI